MSGDLVLLLAAVAQLAVAAFTLGVLWGSRR
jgi:hypothetical protein